VNTYLHGEMKKLYRTKGEVIMAATKKKAAPVTEEKVEAAVKAEVKETTVKAEPVKETVEKAAKTTAKKAKATTTKATTAKKTTKKAELKSELHIQFGGKSYAQEDLVKIAKDVWKYDLKQKVSDLTSVELYVKPEENTVYYVMNNEFSGSFYI